MSTPERKHEAYELALEEARLGLREGGIPIGAVLVRGSKVLGRGHNRRVQHGDPTAHAEIDCLRAAGRVRVYSDTTLYTTATPCYLCTGAILLFGIPQVIIGQTETYDRRGALELLRSHGVDIIDLGRRDSVRLLEEFIHQHHDIWMEDIGQADP